MPSVEWQVAFSIVGAVAIGSCSELRAKPLWAFLSRFALRHGSQMER